MLSFSEILKINPRLDWNAAWRWWREGLLAWLPVGFRRWLAGSARRLVLAVEDGACVLTREEPGHTQELERLDRSMPDWKAIADRFRTEHPQQWVLRVPASQALIRIVTLPLAAEKNLRQVAGFEMDRLTPFAAAQVYYDAAVLERQPESRRLRVELIVLPRAAVEPMLAHLRQQGLPPDALEVAGGRPNLNLLPPEQIPARGLWSRRWRVAVITVSLSLVAAAVALPIWQQRALVFESIARVDQAKKTAHEALALRDQLDKTLESSRMLARKKQSAPARVDLLRELTAILPDDTWLERLQIKGDNVQLIGQSSKASALVGIVEASKWLSGSGFTSPVTTDPRTGKERFMLNAHIAREP
ncbi:MAG: PilN domain-containing protein [Candidatus Competibacteraceae bacterium]